MPGGQLLPVTQSFFQQSLGGNELQGDGKHLLVPHTLAASDISTLLHPSLPCFQKGIDAPSLGSFTSSGVDDEKRQRIPNQAERVFPSVHFV